MRKKSVLSAVVISSCLASVVFAVAIACGASKESNPPHPTACTLPPTPITITIVPSPPSIQVSDDFTVVHPGECVNWTVTNLGGNHLEVDFLVGGNHAYRKKGPFTQLGSKKIRGRFD